MFWFIITALPLLALLWWWRARRAAAGLPRPGLWRGALAVFMLLTLMGVAWALASRTRLQVSQPPTWLYALSSVWLILVLPPSVVVMFFARAVRLGVWMAARGKRTAPENQSALRPRADSAPASGPRAPSARGVLSRRDLLRASALAAPPLVALGATGYGLATIDDFRVTRSDVPVDGLPSALEGFTIAHVSDLHTGRYGRPELLRRVVERTNALRAEMIAFTGDLIDFDRADLPAGVAALLALRAPSGVWLCEGNHDLFQGAAAFRAQVRGAGLALLDNERAAFTARGERVEVLGIRWGSDARDANGTPTLAEHLRETLAGAPRGGGADPSAPALRILLGHHPHALDAAANAEIPLTLSGHSHGGQWMITSNLGGGPLAYRYWSGTYRVPMPGAPISEQGPAGARPRLATGVVSNGVGNWFPVRINAPAEIALLTLRQG